MAMGNETTIQPYEDEPVSRENGSERYIRSAPLSDRMA